MRIEDRCLIVFWENNQRRFIRLAGTSIVILASLFFISIVFTGLSFEIGAPIGIGLVVYFCSRYGKRKLIAIRPDDFFSVNEKPVKWLNIKGISVDSDQLKIDLKSDKTISICLRAFVLTERSLIVQCIKTMWQAAKVSGPLKVPDVADMNLATERLQIRALANGDEDDYVNDRISPGSDQFQLFDALPEELERAGFRNALLNNESSVLYWSLGLFHAETGEYVGHITLSMQETFLQRSATLGIGIKAKSRNQGFGSEAIRELLDYIDGHTNIVKVSSACFASNLSCIGALEKAGMRRAGTYRKFWCRSGQWNDSVEFERVFQRNSN